MLPQLMKKAKSIRLLLFSFLLLLSAYERHLLLARHCSFAAHLTLFA